MAELNTSNPSVPPDDDLLEVRKPTSLLIAQFFLFPLIIIGICIGIFLLFGYITYDQQTPQEYLSTIRSGSGSQRWQAAFELSSLISTQKDSLRDTEFAQSLATVYSKAKEDDPRVRQYLALSLGKLGDSRTVPALLEGLDDVQPENLIYTLWALGSIGHNAAVPKVAEKLKHEDPAVRKVAAYVLGALKDPSAIHALQVALNDVQEEVRWNAAMALAQLGDASGAELLMKLLDRAYVAGLPDMSGEQKSQLVVNAVKCLSLLKFGPAHETITALSQADPDLAVRNASLEALKKF